MTDRQEQTEKQTRGSTESGDVEKLSTPQDKENFTVELSKADESRILTRIDWAIVPYATLLYLLSMRLISQRILVYIFP
ncbi:hypothetical protein M422DRAFT_273461 [Sphaerobolus stellatus SS14]|uniref:Uncharacterized protein n=1 Tax=Sphaerobolus stellatus (strain SS14) TaxID=990650 RepID=A0A0C9U929_SPHS4|nr:hypothetical protein M422DRAFT_273461 [Sphaerobolus stellatus SS14]